MVKHEQGKNINFQQMRCFANDKRLLKNQLRDAQAKLLGIFQSVLDGIVVVDLCSQFVVDCNAVFCEMLGYSQSEIIQMPLQDYYWAEGSSRFIGTITDYMDDKANLKTDIPFKRHDGSIIYVDISSSLIVSEDNKYLIMSIQDATMRRQRIVDRQNGYLKYHTIFDNSHDALLMLTAPHWIFTEVNKAALDMFDMPSVEVFLKLSPCDISPLFQPDGQLSSKKAQVEYMKVMREESNVFAWQFHTASKKRFFADVILTKLEISGEIFLLASLRNMTEFYKSIRLEAKMQVISESEEKFRKIAEMAQDAILLMGADKCISFLNAAAERMFGYTAAEVMGKEIHPLLAPEANESFNLGFINFQKTGAGPIFDRVREGTAHRKNGDIFPVELMVSPLKINGKWNALGIFRDITERHLSEEKIRHMALHDDLTELPNRRFLQERLCQAIVSNKRKGYYGALLYIDLDGFKKVNDSFGHYAGDCLLKEVAQRLTHSLREVDTVARVGGDEFIVLLNELSADLAKSTEQVKVAAEKICNIVAVGYQLSIPHKIEFCCSSSIGVVLFYKDMPIAEELLNWADKAMYQAKKAGGNQVSFFSHPLLSQ